MRTSEMLLHANHLEQLNGIENKGRGIDCVKKIVHCFRLGDEQGAANIYLTEYDKLTRFPTLHREILRIFGCREHRKHNCQSISCKGK